MEHPSGTTLGSTPTAANGPIPAAGPGPIAAARPGPDDTVTERQARADWLITELGRLAAHADDPREQARLRRTADSLVRLAIAFRS